MVETREIPLTVYGLLARRHGVTNTNYVQQIVTGKRKAVRGKAAAILQDWNKLKNSFDDWITEYKADGAMVVQMEDIRVSVYVQNAIARIYQGVDLVDEVDVEAMSLNDFKDFLNGVRIEFN